ASSSANAVVGSKAAMCRILASSSQQDASGLAPLNAGAMLAIKRSPSFVRASQPSTHHGPGVAASAIRRSSYRRSGVKLAIIPHPRSEEHTSELQSRENLVCRLLLEKKKHIIA